MLIRLLGQVAASIDDEVIDLGPAKRRAVFAFLATRLGAPASVEEIIDFVWGDDPPAAARRVVFVHLARLRATLRGAGAEVRTVRSRYVLNVPEASVDLYRFRSAVAEAGRRESPAARWALLAQALTMWTGPPLSGIGDTPSAAPIVAGLERQRISALELRLDAQLALGQSDLALHDLTDLVRLHPLHEPFSVLLMRAALASERRAEGLHEYERLRKLLAEELGIGPGLAAQAAFQALLNESESPTGGPPPIRLLPADVRGFHGRDDEIALLDAIWAAGAPIGIVSGMGGVGKSALAIHWSHLRESDFAAGQLFVAVRGFADGPAIGVGQVLRALLVALAVPDTAIPAALHGMVDVLRATIERATNQRRSLLIVLDNVADPDLVRTVAAAAPNTLIVVTSRDRLAGLVACDGAERLDLRPLADAGSRQVMTTALGAAWADREPAALDVLTTFCHGLPLALRIAAANFDPARDGNLAAYALTLSQHDPMEALAVRLDDRATLRVVFDWSYRRLSAVEARAFALLGAMPIRGWSLHAAVATLGVTAVAARAIVSRLTDSHLIEEASSAQYAVHDLLADFARTRLAEGNGDRHLVLDRLLAFYRASLAVAMARYAPLPGDEVDAPGVWLPMLDTTDDAVSWLAVEADRIVDLIRAGLRAGERQRQAAVDLLKIVQRYLQGASRHHDLTVLFTEATAVAGDVPGLEAMALHGQARIAVETGALAEAEPLARAALAARRRDGDRLGEGHTLNMLAVILTRTGAPEPATALKHEALAAFVETGHVEGQITMWNNIAYSHALRGELVPATLGLRRALDLARDSGNDRMVSVLNFNLARFVMSRLDFDEALRLYRECLAVARREQRPRDIADRLNAIGLLQLCRGEFDEAQASLDEALDEAGRATNRIAESSAAMYRARLAMLRGDHDEAEVYLDAALRLARAAGDASLELEQRCDLAELRFSRGDIDAAQSEATIAVERSRDLGQAHTEARATACLGLILAALGRLDESIEETTRAIALAAHSWHGEIVVPMRHQLADALEACGQHDRALAERAIADDLTARAGMTRTMARRGAILLAALAA